MPRNSVIGIHPDGSYVTKAGSYTGAPYVIRIGDDVYHAERNIAGFAGRQWTLTRGEFCIASDLTSLTDCYNVAKNDVAFRNLISYEAKITH